MLVRLITIISLILFMLLMISGLNVDVALYRSLLVFMILFTVLYLSLFVLNVIRGNHNTDNVSFSNGNNRKDKMEDSR